MDEVDAETDALEQVLALSLQEAEDREGEARQEAQAAANVVQGIIN